MSRLGQSPLQAVTRGRKPSKTQKAWVSGASLDQFPPSRFEVLVSELGIADRPDCWAHHPRVRKFAHTYYKFHYVPDWLLKLWGLDGEANLCA